MFYLLIFLGVFILDGDKQQREGLKRAIPGAHYLDCILHMKKALKFHPTLEQSLKDIILNELLTAPSETVFDEVWDKHDLEKVKYFKKNDYKERYVIMLLFLLKLTFID